MRDCEVPPHRLPSTCATYGEPERVPMDETLPQIPTNPYGQSKLAFEGALKWYSAAYGMGYASLRYFNAAGATERFGEQHDPETHLIPIVLQAAAGKRPHVEIYGDDYPTRDGTCVRDYIHVVDLARAHILALSALRADCRPTTRLRRDGYTVMNSRRGARVTGPTSPCAWPRRAGDPASSSPPREDQLELGWDRSSGLRDMSRPGLGADAPVRIR